MYDDDNSWYQPEDSTPQHLCPCCDHVTLPERGRHLICPVCYWEDDGQNYAELDVASGPNHGITLRQARENFQEFGACDESMLDNVCSREERETYIPLTVWAH